MLRLMIGRTQISRCTSPLTDMVSCREWCCPLGLLFCVITASSLNLQNTTNWHSYTRKGVHELHYSCTISKPLLSFLLIPSLPLFFQVKQVERERALKWGRMIQKWKKYKSSEKLHKRVNKGIPDSVRGAVWKHVLDIEAVKQIGLYEVRNKEW